MQTTSLLVYIFMFVLMEIQVLAQQYTSSCPSGWFGERCRLQCNCEASTSCTMDGLCPGTGQCKRPYFGPGCQFGSLFSVQTIVNNGTFCRSQHFFALQRTVFDVWCYLGIDVISVTIQGAIVGSICTVQMSGGRNVALKQTVYQSSDDSAASLEVVDAHNAVDGDTSQNYRSGSCSQTDFQSTTPSWHLTFDRPYWLLRVIIYSRKDLGEWLDGFSLETYNIEGNRTNWYKDTAYKHLTVYDINLVPSEPVKALQVRADNAGKQIRRALSLCEVQAMGESYCGLTSYGFNCEKTCQCVPNAKCSVITGHCPSYDYVACPPGTFGQLCRSRCSENCQYNVCDAKSGHCHQCVPGYSGDFCDIACPAGKFGPACSLHCSEKCAETCQYKTGTCLCKGKFTGSLCSECARGWYGLDCTFRCSQMCEERICDQRTGKCLSCIGDRMGVNCQSCPGGHFGAFCDKRCSTMCENVTCDSVSGACPSCADGYTGEYCNHEKQSNLLSLWMVPLIVPILGVILCCWIGGRKPRPQPEDEAGRVKVVM